MKKPWSYVTVDASVLSDEWVYNALIWADAIQETTEFLKQVMERGYFTLTEIVKEDHHPFGPALALSGSRGDIEVLITLARRALDRAQPGATLSREWIDAPSYFRC